MSATGEITQGYSLEQSNPATAQATSQKLLFEVKVALGVAAIGLAIAFIGAIAFLLRVKLAQFLLGANVWFSVPVSDTDGMKVLFMTIQTLAVTGWGLFTAGTAFGFAFAKWMGKI